MKRALALVSLTLFTIIIAQTVPDKFSVHQKRCVGCAQCVPVCPVSAIKLVDGRAVIDAEKCISCGLCTTVCPVDAISKVSITEPEIVIGKDSISVDGSSANNVVSDSVEAEVSEEIPIVESSEVESTETTTDVSSDSVPILDAAKCISCARCARACPVKAIQMIDGLPVIDRDKCILCAICVRTCPVDALEMPSEE